MAELPCPHCGYDLSATPMNDGVRLCPECGRSVHRSEIARGLSNGTWYALHAWAVIAGVAVMVGGALAWATSIDGLTWVWLLVPGWAAIAAVVYVAQVLLARSRGRRLVVAEAVTHSLARALVMLPVAAIIAAVMTTVVLLYRTFSCVAR